MRKNNRMATLRLTCVFNFDMAHVLLNYHGKCKNIHGHTYKLEVTVKGAPCNDDTSPRKGMLIDFSDFKKLIQDEIITVWDHALMIHQDSDSVLLNALKNNIEVLNSFVFPRGNIP